STTSGCRPPGHLSRPPASSLARSRRPGRTTCPCCSSRCAESGHWSSLSFLRLEFTITARPVPGTAAGWSATHRPARKGTAGCQNTPYTTYDHDHDHDLATAGSSAAVLVGPTHRIAAGSSLD